MELISSGDKELENILIDAFSNTYSRCSDKAAHAVATGDQLAWKNTLHELKGTSLNIGAQVMADLCQKYEYEENASQQETALKSLQAAYDDLQAAFKQRNQG